MKKLFNVKFIELKRFQLKFQKNSVNEYVIENW